MLLNKKNTKILIIGLVAVLLLSLYGYRLYFPQERYFDEVYHAKRATQFAVEHKFYYRSTIHPPLWHLTSAFFISLLGPELWVVRLPSMICGVILVFLIFFLTEMIFKNKIIAFFAAFLFTFDGVSITQARISMLNSMMLMFMLLSLYCMLMFIIDQKWTRSTSFFGSGLYFSLAFVTRSVASYLLPLYFILIVIHLCKEKKEYGATLRDFILYFIVLPAFVYCCVFLFTALLYNIPWSDIVRFHKYAHSGFTLTQGHNYGSQWWGWPLLKRPIWYHYDHDKTTNLVRGILCIGNQAIFWFIPFSMGFVLWRFLRKREWGYGLILLGFLTQWLPWSLVKRVQFFHFFYTAMPFVCMSIAVLLFRVWSLGRFGKFTVIIYLFLVLGLFIYWYPLLTGYPISHAYYQHHMWFRKSVCHFEPICNFFSWI